MSGTLSKYNLWFAKVFSVNILLLFSLNAYSQKEVNNWYFGTYAGITFNGSTLQALTNGKLNTSEGCATISDKNGKLLFYTDGISVWDSTHSVTPNGTGLKGNSSSTQSAIIVPRPANYKQYYIFTVDDVAGSDGLEYSLFDMSLNLGRGDIDPLQKNVKLISPTCEKITAVKHSNGKDYWVLTHKDSKDTILAYLVTASGVNTTPVKSITGLKLNAGGGNTLGYMKVSPDGKKVAYANWTFDTCGIGDFNSSNGKVTNVWSFLVDDAYGLEFSASGNYLYVGEMYKMSIYQFDAKATSKTNFLSSKVTVDNISKGPLSAMQIGPDKKIYICRQGRTYLDVIHAPDSVGKACRVSYDYVYLSGKTSVYGLPTFIQSYFNPDFSFSGYCFGDTAWFSIADSSVADSVHWTFGDTATKTKNIAKGYRAFHLFSDTGNYNVRSISFRGNLRDTAYLKVQQKVYLGNFNGLDKIVYKCFDDTITLKIDKGDELRVRWSNKSDSLFTRVTDSGYLSVKKYYGSKCYVDDSVRVVYYKNNRINEPLFIGKDILKCYYDSAKLSFYDPKSTKYEWSTGKINTPIYVRNPATIWMKAYYGGSCYRSDTIKINNLPAGNFKLGPDTFVCKNQTIMIGDFDQGYWEYKWSNNSTDPFLFIDTAGTFSLTIKDSLGCHKSDTLNVKLLYPPKVNLGKDTLVCNNSNLVLDAKNYSAFIKYKWGTNVTKQTDTARKTGKYWVRVTTACGTSIDTIAVKFLVKPNAILPKDSIFCNTVTITLDGANTNNDVKYAWNTKATTQTILANDTGFYKIILSNTCGKDSASTHFSKYITPVIKPFKDTTFCGAFNIKLKIGKSKNGEKYSWNDLTTQAGLFNSDSIYLSTTGKIEAVITNKCGEKRDTFLVKKLSNPKLILDSLYEYCGSVNLNLNINKPLNDETYRWSTAQTTAAITIKTAGKYWAKATNYCGMDSVNFRIALYQKPTVNLGKDTTYCGTLNRILNATFNSSKVNYLWFLGQTTPTLLVNNPGKYGVTVSNYCGSAKDSINLSFYKIPNPQIGPDQVFCDFMPPTKRVIKATNSTETYQWSTGGNDTTETFTTPGKYWVKVNSPCGIISDTVDFKLSKSPAIDLGKDTSLCGFFQYILDAQNPGMQYSWLPNGETTQTIIAQKQTTYKVTITSNDGCTGKGQITINGNCISQFWFPNSFTPNTDQLNETFKPTLINFENYEMRIFNRWGELLFETTDIEKGWDGIFKGKLCQSGVYFYVSNFISTENNSKQLVKGTITLLK